MMAAVRGDDGMMGAEQEQIHNSDDGVTWGGAMVWMAIFFTPLGCILQFFTLTGRSRT